MSSPKLVSLHSSQSEILAQVTSTEISSTPASPRSSASNAIINEAALLLTPLCFVALWTVLVWVISGTWKGNRKELEHSSLPTELPCRKCRFFSNNPYLKCAAHPCTAMTKAAIDCPDYQPRDHKISR